MNSVADQDEKRRKIYLRSAFCFLLTLLLTTLFYSVADQFFYGTVNNVSLGVSILVVTFFVTPYFFQVFWGGAVGGGWKVKSVDYFYTLIGFGSLWIFVFVIAYLIENFKV